MQVAVATIGGKKSPELAQIEEITEIKKPGTPKPEAPKPASAKSKPGTAKTYIMESNSRPSTVKADPKPGSAKPDSKPGSASKSSSGVSSAKTDPKPETPVKNGGGENADKAELKAQFEAFAKFGDKAADGKTIKLSQSDKWFKQAKVIEPKKMSTTDTGIAFRKISK